MSDILTIEWKSWDIVMSDSIYDDRLNTHTCRSDVPRSELALFPRDVMVIIQPLVSRHLNTVCHNGIVRYCDSLTSILATPKVRRTENNRIL